MISYLKVGYVVCWFVAFLIDYIKVSSGLATSISFFVLFIYFSSKFHIRIPLNKRNVSMAFIVGIIFISIIINSENFEFFQLCWYGILCLLIAVANGHAIINHSTSFKRFSSHSLYLDVACIFLLMMSLYSSWVMFGEGGAGLVNPNLVSALCGYLLLIYVLECQLCNFPACNKNPLIFNFMITFVIVVGILQFSRAFLFWLLAAYFLKKNFAQKSQTIRGRFILIICVALLISQLAVFYITEDVGVQFLSDAIRNMPGIIRLKGDGLESDVVRLVHYPVLLSGYFSSLNEIFFGLGIGVRPYREQLLEGEDLHNAYLVIASDGGLLMLSVVLLFIVYRGEDSSYQHIVRLLIFAIAAMYGGLLVGLPPFTLCITMLLVSMRILHNGIAMGKRHD